MEGRSSIGSLAARLGLTAQLLGQIFVTPLAAFALTYLLGFSMGGGDFNIRVEVEMIPWIGMASLLYGMIALILALSMGGFTPLSVVERGGWRLALGLTRNPKSSTHRFIAKKRYASSAHGRLSLLVHDRHDAGHALWTIRGSLVLLAIPFQVLLATIPLTLVLLFPEGVVRQNRQLEMALLLYCICLYFSIRFFPAIARRYITLASIGRKLLGNTLRISWVFPVFLLWSMGQLSTYIVQQVLGDDMALNIAFEKQFFESMISASATPESSFLNLLTALAVMPMAAFTTLAVLGGGAGAPPSWMRPTNEGSNQDELREQVEVLSNTVNRLAADAQAPTHRKEHTPSIVQQVYVPVITPVASVQPPLQQREPPPMQQDTASMVDGLDFEGISATNHGEVQPEPSVIQPAHDEPVIRGFDLSDDAS